MASDTSNKLDEGGVLLPVKLLVSVTLFSVWMVTVSVLPTTLIAIIVQDTVYMYVYTIYLYSYHKINAFKPLL